MPAVTNPTHSDATEFGNYIARKGAVPLYGQEAIDMIARAVHTEDPTDSIESVTNPDATDARIHNQVIRCRSEAGQSICGIQINPRWYLEGLPPGGFGVDWETPRAAGDQPEIWLRLRLYIDPDASFASGDDILFIMGGDLTIDEWSDISNRAFDIRAIHDGSSIKLGWFVSGGGGSATSTTACPTGQWFDLELYFRHETSNNADDAGIRIRMRETSSSGDWTTIADLSDDSIGCQWTSDITSLLIGSSNTDTSGTNDVCISHVEWSLDGTDWFDEPSDTTHPGWVEDQGIVIADKTSDTASLRIRFMPGRFDLSYFTHYCVAYRPASGGAWSYTDWVEIATTDLPDEPIFETISGLTPGTRYEFRVMIDTADSGQGSQTANVRNTSSCFTKTLGTSATPETITVLLLSCIYQNFHVNDHDALWHSAQHAEAFNAVVVLGDNIYEGGLSFDATGEPDCETEDDYRRQYDRLFHAHGFRHVAKQHGIYHQPDDHEWADNGRFTPGETPYRDIYTGVTWTESTNTLTKTGELGEFEAGDTVFVRAGTGATLGRYTADSATANTIVLTESIGAGADGQNDIEILVRRAFSQAGVDQWHKWFGAGMLNTVSGADVEDLNYERQFSITSNTRLILDETRSEIGTGAQAGDLLDAAHDAWTKARLTEATHTFNIYASPAYWQNPIVNTGNNPNENWGTTAGSRGMRSEMETIMAGKSGEAWFIHHEDRHKPFEILAAFWGATARTDTDYGDAGTPTADTGSLIHSFGCTVSSGRWSIDNAFKTYKQSATIGDFEDWVVAALDIDDTDIDGNDYIRTGGIIFTLNERTGAFSYIVYDDTGTNRLPASAQVEFSSGVRAGGEVVVRNSRLLTDSALLAMGVIR